MAWIKIDRGLVGHKKIARLSAQMKWSRFQSIGFMTAFWIWAAENCDDGQLGDMGDMEIAFAVNVDGQAEGILGALVCSGFVDDKPRRIHDWYAHQYEYLRSKYRREPEKLEHIYGLYRDCTGTVPVQDRHSTAPEKKRVEEKRVEEEEKKAPALPDWLQKDIWDAFVDHRKRLRKPLTPKAVELNIRTLDRLRSVGNDPRAVIEQSIESGWMGLFPLRDTGKGHAAAPKAGKYDNVGGRV